MAVVFFPTLRVVCGIASAGVRWNMDPIENGTGGLYSIISIGPPFKN